MVTDLVLFDVEENYFNLNYKKIKFSNGKDFKKTDLVLVEGNTVNRDILENKNIHILVSPESGIKKDSLHYRDSGLNQILCNLAKKNNITIAFSFNEFLNSDNRPLLLGRIMQNVKLCRKFKVKMLVCSFARNKYELRSFDTLRALASVIGINPGELNKSFEHLNTLIKQFK